MKKSLLDLLLDGNISEIKNRLGDADMGDLKQLSDDAKKLIGTSGGKLKKGINEILKTVDGNSLAGYTAVILGALNGFSSSIAAGMSNIADGYMGTMKEDVIDLKKLAATLGDDIKGLKVGKLFGDIFTTGIDNISAAFGNAVAMEGLGRDTINKDLGITGELADSYRATLVDAYSQTVLMGAKFEEIQGIVKGTADTLGKARFLSADTIEAIYNSQKALGVSQTLIAESAAAFEDISVGLSSIPSTLDKAGNYARSVGLNVKQYSETLAKNITTLNQFGFKNGIDGLAKMVAKAQSLRLEMSTITSLAEKVFNPEGAIELAAQLQAIGGGFGSFADPLKLVYQATNDMEGLQDSLIGAATSLTTFNQKSGRFEITAVNMRRAKDMADALGMSYSDLTNLAVRAAQKQEMALKVDRMGGDFNEEQKEFLKNMAEMKGGKLVISLPKSVSEQFGDAAKDGFIDITQLNRENTEKLQKSMQDYNEAANRKPTEIATDQLRELERITLLVKSITTKMGISIARSEFVQGIQQKVQLQTTDDKRRQIDKEAGTIISKTEPSIDGVTKATVEMIELGKKWFDGNIKAEPVPATSKVPLMTEKTIIKQPIINKQGVLIPPPQKVTEKVISKEKVIIPKATADKPIIKNNIVVPTKPATDKTKPVSDKPVIKPTVKNNIIVPPKPTTDKSKQAENKIQAKPAEKILVPPKQDITVKPIIQIPKSNDKIKPAEKVVIPPPPPPKQNNTLKPVIQVMAPKEKITKPAEKIETKPKQEVTKVINNKETNVVVKPTKEKIVTEVVKPTIITPTVKIPQARPIISVTEKTVIKKEETKPIAKPTQAAATPKPVKATPSIKDTSKDTVKSVRTKPVEKSDEKVKVTHEPIAPKKEKTVTKPHRPKQDVKPTPAKPVEKTTTPSPKKEKSISKAAPVEKEPSQRKVTPQISTTKHIKKVEKKELISTTAKVKVTPEIIQQKVSVPITRTYTDKKQKAETSPTKEEKATTETKSETITKKEVKVDVNIQSSQTLYDDLVRSMLRDNDFISSIKNKMKESDL